MENGWTSEMYDAIRAERDELKKKLTGSLVEFVHKDYTEIVEENERLKAIMVEHAGKCRGWFGENAAWEIEMFPEQKKS